ncbi:MAG: IS5 family transposase [Actinomycetota bacterium]|nr:IS5 family transposase [Actinomycetota bacterium]
MPALPPYLIEPIWEQFSALLPEREVSHPLGCHRPRIPDGVVFEKLVQVLVFGCAYDERIADASCSATTLRDRRDEWIELGVMEKLRGMALSAYDRIIGLELSEVAVDGCITKAPGGGEKAGRSPVDRGKMGLKRSTAVDASGVPLGAVSAPANRHDSPLLVPTLEAVLETLGGPLPEEANVHLDRGYDSRLTRERLADLGLRWEISGKGKPAPFWSTKRWVVERTSSWHNAHKKLLWCTERVGRVVDFWVAFSDVVIIVRRLIREGWTRYRWQGRPQRQP